MVELEAEAALRLHLFDHAREALMLQFRKFDALRRVLVRHAEVREHSLDVESRQFEHTQNVAQARVKVRLVARKAEAAHAGVELDVHGHLPAQRNGAVGKFLCDVVALHRLRHVQLQNARRLIRGREAQH